MKRIVYGLVFSFILQACAGHDSSNPDAGNASPAAPPQQSPGNPPKTQPESGNYFSAIDQQIAPMAKGDLFVSERFYNLMARLSLYAIICDPKNELGYSTQFSKLWNRMTALQALAEKVYGSEKAAYNRIEKQRNVESRRLSFESGPDACALGQSTFADYVDDPADQLTTLIKTTPRGTF